MTATMPRPTASTPGARSGSVRVGPEVTVVFENRLTLGRRMQELRQFERESGVSVRRQLEWYRQRMPEPGRWPAAVWVGRPGGRAANDLPRLRTLVATGRFLLASSAGDLLPAVLLPHRHTDRLGGLVGWLEFRFDPARETGFANADLRWYVRLDAGHAVYQSRPLVRIGDGFVADD